MVRLTASRVARGWGWRRRACTAHERPEEQVTERLGIVHDELAMGVGVPQRVHDGVEGVALVELGEAGQAEHGGPVGDHDLAHVGLEHGVEEVVEAEHAAPPRRCAAAAAAAPLRARTSRWTCSKTAAKSSVLFTKWW